MCRQGAARTRDDDAPDEGAIDRRFGAHDTAGLTFREGEVVEGEGIGAGVGGDVVDYRRGILDAVD